MVPIKDYKGGHTRSEEDLAQKHLDKEKNKKVPTSWGRGKLRGLDRLKMKQQMHAESFYPRLK